MGYIGEIETKMTTEDFESEELEYENTYIMTPEGYVTVRNLQCSSVKLIFSSYKTNRYGPEQKFQSSQVKHVISEILHEKLEGYEYDASTSSQVRPRNAYKRAPINLHILSISV